MTTTLLLENVSCAGCVKKIEKGINALPDVETASVDFPQRRLNVEGDISNEILIAALADIGYRSRPASNEAEDRARQKAQQAEQYRHHMRNTAFAMALSIPLMIGGMLAAVMVNAPYILIVVPVQVWLMKQIVDV